MKNSLVNVCEKLKALKKGDYDVRKYVCGNFIGYQNINFYKLQILSKIKYNYLFIKC